MKSFKAFRLDTVNHLLWRNGDRVPIAPKGFDVLAYLVEHAGRVVAQDEILGALWPETFVNPEVLRKYILEIRKALGDRPDHPEFVETLPKRGYRFIAPVFDETKAEPPDLLLSSATEESATEEKVGHETSPSEQGGSSGKPEEENSFAKRSLRKLVIIPTLAMVVAAGLCAYILLARYGRNAPPLNNTSISRAAFCGPEPCQRPGVFRRWTRRTID